MKRIALLLALACCSTYATSQSLVWESDENVRPRFANLSSLIFSESDVLTNDYDNDGLVDIVAGGIYRDSLPFLYLNSTGGLIRFTLNDPFFSSSSSSQFLGYLKIPDISGEFSDDNRPLVFGNTEGNNIIGILIAKLSADQESVSLQSLDIGADYRFLSFTDFNDDGAVDFLLFNRDERRLQVWQF